MLGCVVVVPARNFHYPAQHWPLFSSSTLPHCLTLANLIMDAAAVAATTAAAATVATATAGGEVEWRKSMLMENRLKWCKRLVKHWSDWSE